MIEPFDDTDRLWAGCGEREPEVLLRDGTRVLLATCGVLHQLRREGFHVTTDGGRLIVTPAARLARHATLRDAFDLDVHGMLALLADEERGAPV